VWHSSAEVYPVPTSGPEWVPGLTETIVGNWLEKNKALRKDLVIATKVMGYSKNSRVVANRSPGKYDDALPDQLPDARLDADSVVAACEASLRRLKTSYIDLYQLHWPDRYVHSFGAKNYDVTKEREAVAFSDTLQGLKKLLDSGKIRHYGLSNETTFGVGEWVRAADALGIPRPITIQNNFCLLNRSFEGDLAEACSPSHYNIGLLPWSILAGGVLTGKYIGMVDLETLKFDPSIASYRFARFDNYQTRFFSDRTQEQVLKYDAIAKRAGLSLATLSQSFCKSRWYVSSSIIGATKVEHLRENIDAFLVDLSPETLAEIDQVHNERLDPILYTR